MRIGIIGGAGFIGCNLAAYYLRNNRPVTILDNFSRRGTEANLSWLKGLGPVSAVHADIRTDSEALDRLCDDVDVVFHLAAQVAVTTSVSDPREDFEINARGTFNVCEAVRRSARKPVLLYSSTNKVYGKMDDVTIAERGGRYDYRDLPEGIDELRPVDFYSPYGCSKGAGDQYVRDYARIYGLKTLVFRQSCIYGKRQFGIEDQGWVAWFTIAAVLGRPITIYGDGKQVRDILHVSDLVAGYDAAVQSIDRISGGIYNIGGGRAGKLSLLELVAMLEQLGKRKLPVSYAGWRPGDQKVFISNTAKALADFGWQPSMTPAAGIEQLYRWVVDNKSMIAACLG